MSSKMEEAIANIKEILIGFNKISSWVTLENRND
jgi:hypothetical protein